MPVNPDRRSALADAGLRLLREVGSRGLTFRAVDAEAGVPIGTASNYYDDRDAMFAALADRIFERLQPDPAFLARMADLPPTREAFRQYIHDIWRRIATNGDLWLALMELRLEGTRRAWLGEAITAKLRENFAMNVAFNEARGLPGGAEEVALLVYAMDGLLLDRLTPRMTTVLDDPGAAIDLLVSRLLGPAAG
jgi:AcrR family transcriptional regulator